MTNPRTPPHLTTWTGPDGTPLWRVVGTQGNPVSKDVDLKTALLVAHGLYGPVTLAVWDAGQGRFAGEIASDLGPNELGQVKLLVALNRQLGRNPYEGLTSAEIGRYNRALMFGDHDEAFPDQATWSRIVD